MRKVADRVDLQVAAKAGVNNCPEGGRTIAVAAAVGRIRVVPAAAGVEVVVAKGAGVVLVLHRPLDERRENKRIKAREWRLSEFPAKHLKKDE